MAKRNLVEWLKSGEYQPSFLRDFHDQKDLFKRVEEMVSRRPIPNGDSWIGRHVYTIDYFLWFMARHGYTLQKSRQPVEFEDYDKAISEWRETSLDTTAAMINAHFKNGNAG